MFKVFTLAGEHQNVKVKSGTQFTSTNDGSICTADSPE